MSDTYTEFTPAQPLDVTALNTQGFAAVNYGPGDDRKVVLFYTKAVHHARKSQEQGKPVYENHIYVKISEPGEGNLNVTDRPVKDSDKQRWPRQWAQFQNNQKQIPDGTPIEMLFPNNPALGATLKSYGIHTIEQLSHLSAAGIETVGMGAQEWVNKAKSYTEKAEKGVGYHKLQTELAERDGKIAVLQNTVASLKAQLEIAIARMEARPGVIPPLPQVPNILNFDVQTSQINAREPVNYELPPAAFTNEIVTQPPKRRGRPPGSKNKETA
jgi:hypothetical protein